MKKEFLKIFMLLLISLSILSSCGNDDDITNTTIKVDLEIVVSGTLSDSSIIKYRISNGELIEEVLNAPMTWTKTFNVQKGFNLFLKTTGTLEGNISIKANAKGDDVNSINENQFGSRSPSSFDLEVNKNL